MKRLNHIQKLANECKKSDDWEWRDYVNDGLTYEPAYNFAKELEPKIVIEMIKLLKYQNDTLGELYRNRTDIESKVEMCMSKFDKLNKGMK